MLYRDNTPTVASERDQVAATMDKIVSDQHDDEESTPEDSVADENTGSLETTTPPTTQGQKRKFRIIDETKLSEEEARKLELRRAYNRDCASRARIRTKSLVQELQEQVRSLRQEKEELNKSNANLQACLALSEKQNRELINKYCFLEGGSINSMAVGAGNLSILPSSLHGMRLGNSTLAAASQLMLNAEQNRQLNYVQQNLLLQQQNDAAAFSAVAAANAKLFPSTPSSTLMNEMNLSGHQLNTRDQILSSTTASNSDILTALLRMRQNET